VKLFIFSFEDFVIFHVVGVGDTTGDRANGRTLGIGVTADALGALRGIDEVGHFSGRNGRVGALGLASAAIDAFFGDLIRHQTSS